MINKTIYLYEGRDDVTLTTYILDDSVEMLNGKKRGAVLICPGGAYLYCSDREGEPVAMAFAAMGYHAFVLRYSVYNENKGVNTDDNIVPDMEKPWIEKKQVQYPGPVRDVGKAMLCIREHAEEWLVDMDKIALCGFSAGAHVCAMYAVNYDKPVVTEYLGIDGGGIRPAAAVLGYALSDYTVFLGMKQGENALFDACVRAYSGQLPLVDEELAVRLSPCMQVNDHTPPMFLWATAKDQMVDPAQSMKMAMALGTHHIPYELHIFEEGRHGMVLGTYATAADEGHLDTGVERWLHMADKWLQKRMAPEFSEEHHGF